MGRGISRIKMRMAERGQHLTRNIKNSAKVYSILTGLLICVYALFMFWCGSHVEAMVPDEENFFYIIRDKVHINSLKQILHTPNYLGYGSIYWIFMKALNNFEIMRFVSIAALVSCLFCLIAVMRLWDSEPKNIFFAVAIYLSAPLSWFTGKIIGPEILGYAIGVWGGYLILRSCKRKILDKKCILLGWTLLGISAGIKLNYICFGVFIGSYILFEQWNSQEIKNISVKMISLHMMYAILGMIIGGIISSPICILDTKEYLTELGGIPSEFSLRYLSEVLNRVHIEWDLVNSSGLTSTIISIWAFIFIFLLGITYKERRLLVVSAYIASAFLMLICCKARFLGWYLLPIIFFVSVSVPKSRWMSVLLVINILCMYNNIEYQIISKVAQIRNMENIEQIKEIVDTTNNIYSDYQPYYFIETCVQDLPFSIVPDLFQNNNTEKQIIYISERARANEGIDDIYMLAEQGVKGYSILKKNVNSTKMSILLHEDN